MIRYPYYVDHKIEHHNIVDYQETICSKIHEVVGVGDAMASVEEIHAKLDAEIVSLAGEWVIEHLVKADSRMAQFLRKYPEDLS